MQVNQATKQKIQLVELALSDYLFEMKSDYDPLIDAHVAIVSVMRDLKIPFIELEFNQVNQGAFDAMHQAHEFSSNSK